jgi:hypothetical protein
MEKTNHVSLMILKLDAFLAATARDQISAKSVLIALGTIKCRGEKANGRTDIKKKTHGYSSFEEKNLHVQMNRVPQLLSRIC